LQQNNIADLKTSEKLGWKSRLKKQNAIINALKPLLNLEIQSGDTSQILQSETNTVIQISGGIPEGYSEELLDVVTNSNTAGQRYFLTKTS